MKIIDRINMVTLGCSKNLVDTEVLMGRLKQSGFKIRHNTSLSEGEIVIINTCGFIGDAKEESVNTILEYAQAKNDGAVSRLIVMGCLSERYREELLKEIPEIDHIYGKFDWTQLIEDLGGDVQVTDTRLERDITTPGHYAYVKIAEGCDRTCSYCAIPVITGKYQSRTIEDIVQEVEWLTEQGVVEVQLIAQDLTYYGLDIYGKMRLADLVKALVGIEKLQWIRLHYAYPTHFPMDLLPVMREEAKVCAYLDLALQHISDSMLKKMRRNITKDQTITLLQQIREQVPNIHLRTTMLVGHPGETDEDFNELVDFVKAMRFERLGVFAYSEEEGTYAHEHYGDDIPETLKQERCNQLMDIQQEIARTHNQTKVGKILSVIIDRKEEDFYVGRSEFDSPEVDPEVLIPLQYELNIGKIYPIEITAAEDFDLYGKPALG